MDPNGLTTSFSEAKSLSESSVVSTLHMCLVPPEPVAALFFDTVYLFLFRIGALVFEIKGLLRFEPFSLLVPALFGSTSISVSEVSSTGELEKAKFFLILTTTAFFSFFLFTVGVVDDPIFLFFAIPHQIG